MNPQNQQQQAQQAYYANYMQTMYPPAPPYYGGQQMNNMSPQTMSASPQDRQQLESIPTEIASAYKRTPEGQLRWFAAPPTYVTPVSRPANSLAYLEYKQRARRE